MGRPARCARWFCAAVVSCVVACATSCSRPPPAPAPSHRADRDAAPPATASQRAEHDAGAPATACARDAECGFADPCEPARCVASPSRAVCGRASAAEASCVCFEGQCALRPSSPRISERPCESTRECDLELSTARCEPGIAPDSDFRVRYVGPTCGCDKRDHRCHLQWFDPIPCGSTDDCWVDEAPVPHAIPRPARLKGREFRGCVDGERVPACVDGRCTIRALTC